MGKDARIMFLHHSTGTCIWKAGVPEWFAKYNADNGTNHLLAEQAFPKEKPYGWNNYPYDYWNIWVKNASAKPFMEEPTLEMLTKEYDVIIFKHCYPVSDMKENTGTPDIGSQDKTLENYKLQYTALKDKLHSFPQTKFIVWTGAARVRSRANEKGAKLANEFFQWVKNEWDEKNDNIFIWDFNELETEGGLYFMNAYSFSESDSHPNEMFSKKSAPLLCQRIVNVLEGKGDSTSLTGK